MWGCVLVQQSVTLRTEDYLGHWVAESNEDRFLEHLLSASAVIKCGVETMGFGLSGCATWGTG